MLPTVIPEELVSLFKYWQEGIKVGMAYGDELYQQIRVYDSGNRLDAYSDGCQLSEVGSQTCITVSKAGYTLWQNLRSASQNSDGPTSGEGGLPFPGTAAHQGDEQLINAFA